MNRDRIFRFIRLLVGGGFVLAALHERVMRNEAVLLAVLGISVVLIWSGVRRAEWYQPPTDERNER